MMVRIRKYNKSIHSSLIEQLE